MMVVGDGWKEQHEQLALRGAHAHIRRARLHYLRSRGGVSPTVMGFLEAVIAGLVAAALVLWVVRPWR